MRKWLTYCYNVISLLHNSKRITTSNVENTHSELNFLRSHQLYDNEVFYILDACHTARLTTVLAKLPDSVSKEARYPD
jgi:hypothetical protein